MTPKIPGSAIGRLLVRILKNKYKLIGRKACFEIPSASKLKIEGTVQEITFEKKDTTEYLTIRIDAGANSTHFTVDTEHLSIIRDKRSIDFGRTGMGDLMGNITIMLQ